MRHLGNAVAAGAPRAFIESNILFKNNLGERDDFRGLLQKAQGNTTLPPASTLSIRRGSNGGLIRA